MGNNVNTLPSSDVDSLSIRWITFATRDKENVIDAKKMVKGRDAYIPEVGFSIGFERIFSILMENGIDVEHKSKKIAVMYDEGSLVEAIKTADKLRSEGNIASIYVRPKKMGKFLNKLEERNYDGFIVAGQSDEVSMFEK